MTVTRIAGPIACLALFTNNSASIAEVRWRQLWQAPGGLADADVTSIYRIFVAGDQVAVNVLRRVPGDNFYSSQYYSVAPGPATRIAGEGRFFYSSDDPMIFTFDIDARGHFAATGLSPSDPVPLPGGRASVVVGPIGGGQLLVNPLSGQPFRLPGAYNAPFTDVVLSDDGTLALKDPYSGVWTGRPENLRLLAPTGAPVAGTDLSLASYMELGRTVGLRLSENGTVAFQSFVTRNGNWAGGGLFVATPDGTIRRVAYLDQPVANSPQTLDGFRVPLDVGNNGSVIFRGTNAPNIPADDLAFIHTGDALYQIAPAGTPAADALGAAYADVRPSMLLSPEGQLAYLARLTGEGVTPANDLALYTGLPGSERLRLRAGQPVPGIEGATFASFLATAYNDADQLLVTASFAGPGIDASNDVAKLVVDHDNSVSLLYREGTPIDLGDGRTTTLAGLSPPQVAYAEVFTEDFDLAGNFNATFRVNGEITVFRGTFIPEPASALLPSVLITALRRRRCH